MLRRDPNFLLFCLALMTACLSLIALSEPPATPTPVERLWTNMNEQTTKAVLVGQITNSVLLRKDDRVFTVPLEKLSAEDRRYVAELSGTPAAGAKPAAAVTAKIPRGTMVCMQTGRGGHLGEVVMSYGAVTNRLTTPDAILAFTSALPQGTPISYSSSNATVLLGTNTLSITEFARTCLDNSVVFYSRQRLHWPEPRPLADRVMAEYIADYSTNTGGGVIFRRFDHTGRNDLLGLACRTTTGGFVPILDKAGIPSSVPSEGLPIQTAGSIVSNSSLQMQVTGAESYAGGSDLYAGMQTSIFVRPGFTVCGLFVRWGNSSTSDQYHVSSDFRLRASDGRMYLPSGMGRDVLRYLFCDEYILCDWIGVIPAGQHITADGSENVLLYSLPEACKPVSVSFKNLPPIEIPSHRVLTRTTSAGDRIRRRQSR